MFTIAAVLVAVVGGFVQSWRSKDRLAADVHMVWWMVAVVGFNSLLGAGFHVLDGPHIATLIGYTRGDGGFQWENAMGDLAIGVVGIMAYWFRGHFWLATIVVLSVQYLGDAAGHIYFWIAEHNVEPDNIGVPLWIDVVLPIIVWALYVGSRRHGGDAVPDRPVLG